MFRGKTYWIIGASEGLGRELAYQLGISGANLILSARNEARLHDLAASLNNASPLQLDVSDRSSVSRACADLPPVDGVIYCAGSYDPMAAKDWHADAFETMAAVNFLGAARVLGNILPNFIERNRGHVVLIGSLAGFRGLPSAIGYGATKAALMHLAENIYADLRGTGVTVQIINPGFIKTRLTRKNSFHMPQIMPADEAARHVIRAMKSKRFSTSFPRPFAWMFTWGRFLPSALFYRLFPRTR